MLQRRDPSVQMVWEQDQCVYFVPVPAVKGMERMGVVTVCVVTVDGDT